MDTAHRERPATRRVAEPVLAVLTVLLAAGVVTESAILFDSALGLIWLPVAILIPGLLALSVLVGALAHGIRLGSAVLDTGDRIRPGDTAATRVLASVALGSLAAYVLFWVGATLYVHYLANVGGVSPSVWPPLFGGVLGALALGRAVFFQVFPEGPLSRLRGMALE
ncbi:hypothetical protein [Halostagnicola bangensis]